MWDPMPTLEPLLAGQGSVEPASKRAKRAGDERDGGVQLHALEGSSRHDLGKGATLVFFHAPATAHPPGMSQV